MAGASITTAQVNKKDIITGQQMSFGAGETTEMKFDPRSSSNIISPGNVNHKVLGDYEIKSLRKMTLRGVTELFMSSPATTTVAPKPSQTTTSAPAPSPAPASSSSAPTSPAPLLPHARLQLHVGGAAEQPLALCDSEENKEGSEGGEVVEPSVAELRRRLLEAPEGKEEGKRVAFA